MMRLYKPMVALCAAATLSACSVLPESQPPRIVGLENGHENRSFNQSRPVSLRVDTPVASAPFDSNLVLIQPEPWEYQALPDVRWRDSMPAVIRDRLIRALRASNGFKQIVAANSAATAEFSLLSELTAFHASTSEGETTVTLAMHFELMENRTRQTRCTHEETLEIRADNTRLPSLMTAFSKGSHQLSESTVSWAHECLAGTVKMK